MVALVEGSMVAEVRGWVRAVDAVDLSVRSGEPAIPLRALRFASGAWRLFSGREE